MLPSEGAACYLGNIPIGKHDIVSRETLATTLVRIGSNSTDIASIVSGAARWHGMAAGTHNKLFMYARRAKWETV